VFTWAASAPLPAKASPISIAIAARVSARDAPRWYARGGTGGGRAALGCGAQGPAAGSTGEGLDATRSRLARALLPALLAGLAIWALQTLALRRGNTLHANGRWESTKAGLDRGILGAVSFLTTRTALHRDRLDLGAWHGYHELLLREPLAPARLALRFRLPEGGWLAVITAHDGARFEALRVSREPGLPSACLAGTAAGAFTRREPLAAGAALDAGWHRLALVREGAGLAVSLDGAPAGACPAQLAGPARIGLRGSGADHVLVDDLEVESLDPPRRLREDFANRRRAGLWLAAALGAVALADTAVARRLRRRVRGAALAPALALANGVLAACAGLALLADTLYFGRIHPERVDFAGYENRIEYEGQIVPRLARQVGAGPAPPGVRRLLALGTSQTWGSGAARPEDVWVRRLEAALQAEAPRGERYQLIGGGLPGERSRRVREVFERRWLGWEPELVLVTLGNNDRDAALLAREVERLAERCAERGVRLAFVPEPNATDSRSERSLRGLREKHEALRAVAARRGIPVLEVHEALEAERDTGFLWWDRVHLTSYGQERLAALLFAQRARWLGAPGGEASPSGP
jgi:lysophospholipase L1-like esterase